MDAFPFFSVSFGFPASSVVAGVVEDEEAIEAVKLFIVPVLTLVTTPIKEHEATPPTSQTLICAGVVVWDFVLARSNFLEIKETGSLFPYGWRFETKKGLCMEETKEVGELLDFGSAEEEELLV